MADRCGNNGNHDRLFLAPKLLRMVTVAMKLRCLLLGRKALTNLDSTLKRRNITLLTKVYLVKATVFPVVMYGCESWTIKKLECQRMDAFDQWCWKRLLRVPGTARRSNLSTLKEINPEYSLEELMLKLKLQYFGHLMRRTDSLEKTLMLGKTEGRRRGQQDETVGWHHQSDGHEFGQAPGAGDGQESLACCSPRGSQRVKHSWASELNTIAQSISQIILIYKHFYYTYCLWGTVLRTPSISS